MTPVSFIGDPSNVWDFKASGSYSLKSLMSFEYSDGLMFWCFFERRCSPGFFVVEQQFGKGQIFNLCLYFVTLPVFFLLLRPNKATAPVDDEYDHLCTDLR